MRQFATFEHIRDVQSREVARIMEPKQDRAFGDFDRTAYELAGEDQTLRRVLAARLRDAYLQGQHHVREEAHVRFEVEHSLPVERYYEDD